MTQRPFAERVAPGDASSINRRSFLAGAAATLTGCNSGGAPSAPRDILKSIGITKGPALVYVSINGCTTDGPHNYENMKSIIESSQLPLHMIDLNPLPGVTTIKDKAGNTLPGIYHAAIDPNENDPDKVAGRMQTLGFKVTPSDMFNHGGNLILLDAGLNPVQTQYSLTSKPPKGTETAAHVQHVLAAIQEAFARTTTTASRGR